MIDNSLLKALEIRFDSDAGNNLTIRDYLHILLNTLWYEGESFNSKRPFGNNSWQFDIYKVLIKNEYIQGTLDDNEYINEVNLPEANEYVLELIKVAFYGVK